MIIMKTCSVCKEEKSLDSYYNYKTSKDGKCYRCKSCDDIARRRYKENNPEREAYASRNKSLKWKYGIDIPQYENMVIAQDSKCAICKVTENKVAGVRWSFAVDHCHTTGKIRGLLCNQCNRALGMFSDSIAILERATEYLKQSN